MKVSAMNAAARNASATNSALLEALAGIPAMESGRRLVVVWGQLGDFDSVEYAQALVPVLPQLSESSIALHAFAIGNAAGHERFCHYTGFPPERLTVLPDNHLHRALDLYGGLATAEGSPTSNLPLRAGKGYLYEGGIRVPLLVRWPGVVTPGTTCDVPVTTLDVAATLLAAGGASPPADEPLDGTPLEPLLDGTAVIPARDLHWHYPHYSNQGSRPAAALVAGDGPVPGAEKLVEHYEDGRLELFDLASDPGERRNLAAERPERARALHERLVAWRERVAAVMPRPNPEPVEPYGPAGVPGRPPKGAK